MAIFTPRGLKIRLPVNYTFGLLARLYPEVDAFKVLKTVEGIEYISYLITMSSALLSFYFHLNLMEIGLVVFITSIISFILSMKSLLLIKIFHTIATLFSYIAGFGLVTILIVLYGYFTVGIEGVGIFLLARFLAGLIKLPISSKLATYHKDLGYLEDPEVYFIYAYKIWASKLAKSSEVILDKKELETENWSPVLNDLATKWPEVVRRFTVD